ncbi:MAG: hypothetical protein KA149_02150 [Chitinophagales bacterium]|nr:hypothetical protein [Chitinophagales bacterium]
MKKSFLAIATSVLLLVFVQTINAQAWDKSTKVLSLGVGGSNFAHIYSGSSYYGRYSSFNSPLTAQLNFQGEFGVHDYVGVGFTTGLGGGPGYNWGRGYYGYYYGSSAGELTVPVGFIANFHFFQLIADKTGKDIHSDKLDVYAGASLGSGIAAQFDNNGAHVVPIAFGGIHVGVRYYFNDRIGVNGELGTPYGKSFVNAGVVFKL